MFNDLKTLVARIRRSDSALSGPFALDRRSIYILPTRSGLYFAVLLMAMLIGAINYSINLGYLLTFLLAGIGVGAILFSFKNLHGLILQTGHPLPVFAGEEGRYPLTIENPTSRPRFALEIVTPFGLRSGIDIEANSSLTLNLTQACSQRGLAPLQRIQIRSIFPLGLLRPWTPCWLKCELLVYPKPMDFGAEVREVSADGHSFNPAGARGDEEFAGMRPYQPGDPLRQIHWKGLAKGQPLMSKLFGGGHSQRMLFDWAQLAPMPLESRLSQLCYWIIDAEAKGDHYGLCLPGKEISASQGSAHRHLCLEALALFGKERER